MYSLYMGINLSSLSSVYTELKRASGAAERVFEICDRVPPLPIAAGEVRDPASVWVGLEVPVGPQTGLLGSLTRVLPGRGSLLERRGPPPPPPAPRPPPCAARWSFPTSRSRTPPGRTRPC